MAAQKSSTIPRCGATKRNGEPCQAHGMKNGRCRVHGGLSTGAPKGNTNGLRHGYYYNALLPDEQELWPQAVEMGSGPVALEQELALMRVKLQRLLRAANDETLAARIEKHVDIILKADDEDEDTPPGFSKRELKTSLPRIGALIVEAVETIRKLSLSISQLRLTEKELLADQQDQDTDINININVVSPAGDVT